MTKVRIDLSKEDVQRIVLKHLDSEYNLSEYRRPGRSALIWTDDGGLIFERDDTPPTPKSLGEPDWNKLVSEADDDDAEA